MLGINVQVPVKASSATDGTPYAIILNRASSNAAMRP